MPILLTEINALCEQVRSDGGCVIQCHLLEAKTCDEENSSDEVLTLGHVVNTENRQSCRRKAISDDAFVATEQTHLA